jgi:hypothetical protein
MGDTFRFDDRYIDWALFTGFDDLWHRIVLSRNQVNA